MKMNGYGAERGLSPFLGGILDPGMSRDRPAFRIKVQSAEETASDMN